MMVTTTQTNRVEVAGRVSQVVLPADARALGNRSRVDYEDAFIVDAGGRQTAEQWARAVFSDAPLAVRARLVAGWLGLGLKLGGPWSTHRLLGSKVAQSSPDVLVRAAESILGLQAELLFATESRGLLFATLV